MRITALLACICLSGCMSTPHAGKWSNSDRGCRRELQLFSGGTFRYQLSGTINNIDEGTGTPYVEHVAGSYKMDGGTISFTTEDNRHAAVTFDIAGYAVSNNTLTARYVLNVDSLTISNHRRPDVCVFKRNRD
jgi:hypothetical protein